LENDWKTGGTQNGRLGCCRRFYRLSRARTIDFDVVAVTDVTLCCFPPQLLRGLIETTPHYWPNG